MVRDVWERDGVRNVSLYERLWSWRGLRHLAQGRRMRGRIACGRGRALGRTWTWVRNFAFFGARLFVRHDQVELPDRVVMCFNSREARRVRNTEPNDRDGRTMNNGGNQKRSGSLARIGPFSEKRDRTGRPHRLLISPVGVSERPFNYSPCANGIPLWG